MLYYLIDDALCDLNEEIDTFKDCKDCPYFYECMEVEEEEYDED